MKKNCSGETIVEVLVSAMIFLLLMAVLQGAIMFSNAAQKKSSILRKNNTSMLTELHKGSTFTPGDSESYTFYAYNKDESIGGAPVFTVNADRGKKTVSYEDVNGDHKTAEFYVFGKGGTQP